MPFGSSLEWEQVGPGSYESTRSIEDLERIYLLDALDAAHLDLPFPGFGLGAFHQPEVRKG